MHQSDSVFVKVFVLWWKVEIIEECKSKRSQRYSALVSEGTWASGTYDPCAWSTPWVLVFEAPLARMKIK